jgi:phosphoribosylamine--glycine ligase
MLEKSKIYTKEICDKYNVPTGKYKKFSTLNEAYLYCDTLSFPVVIKADGLAAGKGVIIAKNLAQAQQAVLKCMKEEVFNEAGKKIIIEEFLEGEEISLFSLVDSKGHILPLTTAQDHKKIQEGEKGLNTGGMGAYSPVPSISDKQVQDLSNQFISPIVQALKEKNINYKGMFYAGIILTKKGPRLLEINVRFGDPETQAILPRIKSDVLELLYASATESLNILKPLKWDPRYCMTVVMSTKGYPEEYQKGTLIENLDLIKLTSDNFIFHAGTNKHNHKWLSNGGRVLAISSLGESMNKVKKNVYSIVNRIKWKDGYYRKDIGWRYT